jgi:trimeric autotransporter adhesin
MQRTKFRLATAIAVLALAPIGASAQDSLDIASAASAMLNEEQTLSDNTLELGSFDNSIDFAGDVATDASGAIGLNMTAGDFNLQDNAAVLALIADAASSETYAGTSLSQTLFGNTLDGAAADAQMRSAVSVDISASGDVAGNVGLNAVSGAFNIQSNAVAIAAVPGSMLAQAQAGLTQNAQQNLSIHHDAVNDVMATIILDSVSGNVGMNLASGVGNVQSNSITIARPF